MQDKNYLDIFEEEKPKGYLDIFDSEESSPSSYGDSFVDNLREGFVQGGKGLVGGGAKAIGAYSEVFTDADWTQTIQEWGEKYSKDVPEPDGSVGQFLGSLVPSTLPTAGAIAATALTGGAAAPLIAGATAGGLGLSSAGQGMMEYEDYKKSKGEIPNQWEALAAGTAYGAAEYLFERLAIGKLLPEGSSKKLIGNTDKAVEAGKELLASWSKKNPSQAKKLISQITKGSVVEGSEEALTELSQSVVDNFYREDSDDYGLGEISERMAMAFTGGALMGTGLGAMSYAAQNKIHNDRRKKQGNVVLAKVGNEAEEVIAKKGEDDSITFTTMDATGKIHERRSDEVSDVFTLPTDQFFNVLKGKVQETEAIEQEELRRKTEAQQQAAQIFDNEIAPLAVDTEQGPVIITAIHKNVNGVVKARDGKMAVFQPTDENYIPQGEPVMIPATEIADTAQGIPLMGFRDYFVGPEITQQSIPTKGDKVSINGVTATVTGYDKDSGGVSLDLGEDADPMIISREQFDQFKQTYNGETQDLGDYFDEEGNVDIKEEVKEEGEPKELEVDGTVVTVYKKSPGVYRPAYSTNDQAKAKKEADRYKKSFPKLQVKVVDVSDPNDDFAQPEYRIELISKSEQKGDKSTKQTANLVDTGQGDKVLGVQENEKTEKPQAEQEPIIEDQEAVNPEGEATGSETDSNIDSGLIGSKKESKSDNEPSIIDNRKEKPEGFIIDVARLDDDGTVIRQYEPAKNPKPLKSIVPEAKLFTHETESGGVAISTEINGLKLTEGKTRAEALTKLEEIFNKNGGEEGVIEYIKSINNQPQKPEGTSKKSLGGSKKDQSGNGDVSGQVDKTKITDNSPEAILKRGFYTKDGVTYDRQEPLQAERGRKVKVKFATDVSVDSEYALIESSDLQPSHRDGQKNPIHFIGVAQPKDRSTGAGRKTASGMRNNLDPEELGPSVNAYFGPPIVNNRGEVIQGNGRADGIIQYLEGNPDDPKGYRDYLLENKDVFGLTEDQINNMDKPILVRMVDSTDQENIKLGQYTANDLESGGSQVIVPQATFRKLSDKQKESLMRMLSESQGETMNQMVRSIAGKAVSFLQKEGIINETQAETVVSFRTGQINKDGIGSLTDVFMQFVFDGGDMNLPKHWKSLDYRVEEALSKAFPDIFKPGNKSLLPEVQLAIVGYVHYKNSGIPSVRSWANTPDMFKGGITPAQDFTPAALKLIELFDSTTTQKEIQQFFGNYANLVSDKAPDMFNPNGTPGVTPKEAISQLLGIDYEPLTRQEKRKISTSESLESGKDDGKAESGEMEGRFQLFGQPENSGVKTKRDVIKDQLKTAVKRLKELRSLPKVAQSNLVREEIQWLQKEIIRLNNQIDQTLNRDQATSGAPQGTLFQIAPGTIVSFDKLSKENASWYGAKEGDYVARLKNKYAPGKNGGFMPTNLLMGVINGKYHPNTPLSQQTGAFLGPNLGTASILVKGEKLEAFKTAMRSNGYEIEGDPKKQYSKPGTQGTLFQKDLFQYLPEVTLDGSDETNIASKIQLGAFYPQRKAEVEQVAKGILGKWKNAPNIKVLESALDLQNILQQLYGSIQDDPYAVSGFYDPRVDPDNIYLVASHAKFKGKTGLQSSILNTVLHEAVGHYGLRGMIKQSSKDFQQEFDGLMDEILSSFKGDVRLDQLANRYYGEGISSLSTKKQRVIAEELLAHIAQEDIQPSLRDKILTFIRRLYRELTGNYLKLSDSELISIIGNSRKFVEVGQDNYVPRMRRSQPLFQKVTQPKSNLKIYGQKPGESRPPKEGIKASAVRFQKAPPTDSFAFKKWFGDSKVVNENGDPLVVYHGTDADFNVFDRTKGNKRFNAHRSRVLGEFFSIDPEIANSFAKGFFAQYGGEVNERANIMPVYLSIQNPKQIGSRDLLFGSEFENEKTVTEYRKSLIKEGYDGVFVIPESDFSKEGDLSKPQFIAFSPTQIKSATGNDGQFDGNNPDIRFQIADPISSENFKKWFGKSKMVDKNGQPIKAYHGTVETFTEFEKRGHRHDAGYYGDGFYFTFGGSWSKGEAEYYGPNVMEVYLKIENPFDFSSLTKLEGQDGFPIGDETIVFLMNIAEKFPELSDRITINKTGQYDPKIDGSPVEEIPISQLKPLFDKYLPEVKIEPVYEGSEVKYKIAFGKTEIVEYTRPDGTIHKWEDKEELGRYSEQYPDEKIRLSAAINALEKYEGISADLYPEGYMTRYPEITEAIKKAGHDGIVQTMEGDEAVVFNANQIKSTRNEGTYNPEVNDIRFQINSEKLPRFQVAADINTEEFKVWFGDSVIKNSDGTPKVIYHGGPNEITTFDESHGGETTADNEYGAFYFSDIKAVAEDYGRQSLIRKLEDQSEEDLIDWYDIDPERAKEIAENGPYDYAEENMKIVEAYGRMENPLVINADYKNLREVEETFNIQSAIGFIKGVESSFDESIMDYMEEEYSQSDINDYQEEIEQRARENYDLSEDEEIEDWQLKDATREVLEENEIYPEYKAFDGIIIRNVIDDIGDQSAVYQDVHIFIDPNQIKSVYNTGSFSTTNNDIRFQITGIQGASNLDMIDGVKLRMDALQDAIKIEKEEKITFHLKYLPGGMPLEDLREVAKMYSSNIEDLRGKLKDKGLTLPNGSKYKSDKFEIFTSTVMDKVQARTGWFRGADNLWRYEVEDVTVLDEVDLLKDIEDVSEGKGTILTDFSSYFNHDLLEKAYPGQINSLRIKIYNNPGTKTNGYFERKSRSIGINAAKYSSKQGSPGERIVALRSTISHELAHLVQGIEGFEQGGNLEVANIINQAGHIYRDARTIKAELTAYVNRKGIKETPDLYFKIIKDLNDFWVDLTGKPLNPDERTIALAREYSLNQLDNILSSFPHNRRVSPSDMDIYESISGEVEARAVQKRLKDKLYSFRSSEEISREDQILLSKVIDHIERDFYNGDFKEPESTRFQKQLSIFDVDNNYNVHYLKTTTGQKVSYKIYQGSGNETRSNLLQRPEGEGERSDYALIERQFTENKTLDFTGGLKIHHTDDVAYLFKNLEDESIEQVFAVYVMEDGGYVAQHISSGLPYASIADVQGMVGNAIGMNAKQFYFVHNHPSGNLKASDPDINIFKKLKTAFKDTEVLLMPGVIINLRSGKYLQFSDYHQDKFNRPNKTNEEVNVTIHQFNKQIMNDEEYNAAPTISHPEQVAEFLSHRRFGKSGKIEALLLNRPNTIVGKISLTEEKMFEQIAAYSAKHSATSVILYGNKRIGELNFHKFKEKLNSLDMVAHDFIEVRPDGYFSHESRMMVGEPLFQKSPTFYSNSLRALQSLNTPKATFDQWKAMLLKNGASQAELDWIGFDELKGKKLTREEVIDFISSNQIEVVDVIREQSDDKRGRQTLDFPEDIDLVPQNIIDIITDWEQDGGLDQQDLREILDPNGYLPVFDMSGEIIGLEREYDDSNGNKLTKYSQFTLPGGENYKEVLLTMPYGKFDPKVSFEEWNYNRSTWGKEPGTMDEYKKAMSMPIGSEKYKSSHWDEPNILAHIRFNERSVNGEKVLFIEELQSDWQQAGRKKGWKGNVLNTELSYIDYRTELWEKYNVDSVDALQGKATPDELRTLSSLWNREDNTSGTIPDGVPNMPFKNTSQWLNLSMRRMIRYASENGFDRIAWVNGEQSAERYANGLLEVVDNIEWSNQSTTGDAFVTINTKKSGDIRFGVDRRTGIVNNNLKNAPQYVGKSVDEILGKEIGEAIIAEKFGKKEGDGLRIGGEGMKDFYNKIVPTTTSKLLKKLDKTAKVETIALSNNNNITPIEWDDPLTSDADYDIYRGYTTSIEDPAYYIVDRSRTGGSITLENADGDVIREGQYSNVDEAMDFSQTLEQVPNSQQLSFPITPKIRQKAIQEGLPLFQKVINTEEDPIIQTHRFDHARLAFQDKYLLVKRLQESKLDDEIEDSLNAYNYENLSKGIVNDLLDKFKKNHIRKFDQLIQDLYKQSGITYQQTQRYLKAKHIVDDQVEEGGIPMEEARQIVRNFKKNVNWKQVAELEKITQDINQYILNRQYETGLISKERYDELQSTFSFYVPLRGFANGMEIDPTIFTKDIKRQGRTSESGDPIPYLFAMAQTAIQKGQQNLVKQRFLNFLKEVPDPRLFSIKNVWYANINGNWEVFTNRPPQEIFDNYEVRRSIPIDGLTEEQIADLKVKSAFSKDAMTVMVNGKRIIIEGIGEGQKVIRSIMNADIDKTPGLLKFLGKYTRLLTKFYTQYSPEFAIRNLIRDMTTGLVNIRNDYGSATAMSVLTESLKGQKALFKAMFGQYKFDKPLTKTEWNEMNEDERLQEFIENGGMTGYSDLKDVATYAKEMENTIEKLKGNTKSWGLEDLSKALKPIDNINRVFENTVRFAAYKTLRNKGISKEKAAMYAKDLTVNFNRKGNWSNTFSTIYLFFNAGTQGIERLLRPFGLGKTKLSPSERKTRIRALQSVVMLGGVGLMLQVMNRMLGGKDEDDEYYYDKLPTYTRTHNIVIPKTIFGGKEGEFFQIPLPYGYNTFFAVPDHFIQGALGRESATEVALGTFAVASESFSPLGSPDLSGGLVEGMVKYGTPTIAEPMVDFMLNKNFAGSPIYKESFFPGETPRPNSQMYYKSVNPLFREITDALNSATGGDEEVGGAIDINPEWIDHFMSSYGGGAFHFIDNMVGSAFNLFSEGVDTYKDPDLRRSIPFVRNYDTSVSGYYNQGTFYDNVREVKAYDDIYKRYFKSDRRRAREYRNEHRDKLALALTAGKYEDKVKALQGKKKQLEKAGKNTEEIDKMLDGLYIEFNKMYNGKKEPSWFRDLLGI